MVWQWSKSSAYGARNPKPNKTHKIYENVLHIATNMHIFKIKINQQVQKRKKKKTTKNKKEAKFTLVFSSQRETCFVSFVIYLFHLMYLYYYYFFRCAWVARKSIGQKRVELASSGWDFLWSLQCNTYTYSMSALSICNTTIVSSSVCVDAGWLVACLFIVLFFFFFHFSKWKSSCAQSKFRLWTANESWMINCNIS